MTVTVTVTVISAAALHVAQHEVGAAVDDAGELRHLRRGGTREMQARCTGDAGEI